MIYIYFSCVKYVILICLLLNILNVSSQSKTELYVKKYSDLAVKEMKQYKIPASITLSQGILESGNGESRLATKGNNHFGIKCHGWKGKEIYADDDEENECFRKYRRVEDSFRDHSIFLSNNGRYSFLFELDLNDYKGWAHGLKKAGYATSPNYAEKLISLIEKYNLSRFDKYSTNTKEQELLLSYNYGFPFIFGLGLNYFNENGYIISADISSSFIFNSSSVGIGVCLSRDLYTQLSVNGIYHGFYEDKVHKISYGINPKLSYLFSTKDDKEILVNLGFIYSFEKINDYSFFPSISLSYLIDN